jgi:membrane protease YdiL (CAAX protease family)
VSVRDGSPGADSGTPGGSETVALSAPAPVAATAATSTAPAGREHLGFELLGVLGISLGLSGLTALLSLIRDEVSYTGGVGSTTQAVVNGIHTTHALLDFADNMVDILHGVAPPLLALVLLARTPGGPGFGIGFDLRRRWREAAQGFGFFALIGSPGLALIYLASRSGVNASLAIYFPDVWYRIPYLILAGFQNGFLEEIVVVGFMLTRLAQIGWSKERALLASALLRGSYHLYQGVGGFAGNLVMGLIFGWWFQRTGRVLPLVIAHTLLDAVSFVGYIYLHNHISWI